MGRANARTTKQIIAAIKGTNGVQATIAKNLGVARQTVAKYIRDYPTVRAAYEDEKAVIDDAALSVVIDDIVTNKDVGTAKWWLTKKVSGFGDKVTIDWRQQVEREGIAPDLADKVFEADVEAMLGIMTGEPADSDV